MAKPDVIIRRAPDYDPAAIEISMGGNHLTLAAEKGRL
jgi:hypothetical protein